jgi:SSS family solute:Na+ symporter
MGFFLLAAAAVVFFFVLLGSRFRKAVSGGKDYSLAGRKASSSAVSGVLLGALVGGASTVGTVQMAYEYGLAAWWFTLGGGIGCLVLGLWFAIPLRSSGVETIPGHLTKTYNRATGTTAMWASTIGTFISVVAQFLAGMALLAGILPGPAWLSALLIFLFVLAFLFGGGLKGYSSLGVAKIFLLYGILILCAATTLFHGHSPAAIFADLPRFPFFSLFGNGLGKGLSAGVSLVVGVLCTQIYIQAVFSASSPETARRGALLSAGLMPPLGLLGVWVGLGLRHSGVEISSSEALTYFIETYFHPALGGLLWGGLLITVIGTAAGLSLGIATNLVYDCYVPLKKDGCGERHLLAANRGAVALVVFLAAMVGLMGKESLILEWSYLSMGLRGAGTFFPLIAGITAPKRLSPRWAFAASLGGLAVTILWPLTQITLEPLFAGLGASGLLTAAGLLQKKGGAIDAA